MAARKPLNDPPAIPKAKIARKTLGNKKDMTPEFEKVVAAATAVAQILVKKPVKPGPDPVDRPMIDPHGYGKPQFAFTSGLGGMTHINKGKSPIEEKMVKVFYREKWDKENDARVRIYYAGKLLIGSATLTPLLISSRFLHQLAGDSHQRHADEKALHKHIGELLEAQP